jgi:hypothetical protein
MYYLTIAFWLYFLSFVVFMFFIIRVSQYTDRMKDIRQSVRVSKWGE